ncbi:thiamine phosphate synthase [Sulfurimonas sp. HSL3-7]|uniref:thiamine phosphate synthase n=1 Tax=Sulfonitrofixus jiaomeiensis TaxID=3131938 RepID=UPI0031F93A08
MQLYALCDQSTLDKKNYTLEAFVALCNRHDAQIIQYRNKSGDLDVITQQLKTLRALWSKTLIINDTFLLHPFCDGVHLGQEDLYKVDRDPVTALKKIRSAIGKEKLIGLSTHNKEEIDQANRLDLDYIGLGAFRATRTKEDAAPLKERLDALAAGSKHPVAAIGGVRFEDVFENVKYRVISSALYGED